MQVTTTLAFERVSPCVYRLERHGVEVIALFTETLLAALEPTAMEQLERALALPGLERGVVTPDFHTGFAVPIGFTAVSPTHLYPDTVGPDPACSVSLSQLPAAGFGRLDKRGKRAILDELGAVIGVTHQRRQRRGRANAGHPPLAFDELMAIALGRRRSPKTWVTRYPPIDVRFGEAAVSELEELLHELVTARTLAQVGTIGGGNHFLEVQLGDGGDLYVMAHFGSRGLGATGAERLMAEVRVAQAGDEAADADGASLLAVRAESDLGRRYFMFQQAMLEYATYNHVRVQALACDVLCRHLGLPGSAARLLGHIPHNFMEERRAAYWQRKGATPAYDSGGIPLLIPGSMATASYVLAPGPEAERLGACVPHGAGRVLSRGRARETLDQADMDRRFDETGALGSFRHVPLDESSGAYKDVDEVIRAVVEPGAATIVERLRPALVLKGS